MEQQNLNFTNILVDEMIKILDGKKLTTTNMTLIVFSLMQAMERCKTVSGLEKKLIVINALNKFIETNVNDEVESQQLQMIVTLTVPTLIDTLVSVDSGELRLRMKKLCFMCK
jgi:hypothetical protein